MPITVTEHDTFAKTAFFDNREWLNQENWQMYFGGSLPTGVIVKGKLESSGVNYTSALSRYKVNASYIQFRAGDIMANGIFARYNGGFNIPAITSSQVDRFFVARVYLGAGSVKIVSMTKVAAEYGYTPTVFAKMLLDDESLCCTRNETYYDIPLLYEIFGGEAYDLRRLIYLPGKSPDVEISFLDSDLSNTDVIPGIMYGKYFVQVYGGMSYNVAFNASDASTYFYVDPIPVCSEKPVIVKLTNNSAVSKEIRIPLQFKGMQYSYSWLESWSVDSNSRYIYRELVAHDKMTLILTLDSHETTFGYTVTNKSSAGGGMDPEDYYTKQEMSALLLLKANVSDVTADLALKEDKTALGDLAYQDTANYVTQVTNKPTLGALASKDKVVLTTDVTGTLQTGNGGTGISQNPSMKVNLESTSADNVLKTSPRPGVTGVLPVENGGTGATSLAGIIAAVTQSQTIYVNGSSGNDTTGDGTSAKPYKTIQKAVNSISIGDIIISAGTYSGAVTINRKNITLQGSSITINGVVTINNSNVVLNGAISISATREALTMINSTVYFEPINETDMLTISATYTGNSANVVLIHGGIFAVEQEVTGSNGTVRLISSGNISIGIRNYGGFVSLRDVSCSNIYQAFVSCGGVITHGTTSGATHMGYEDGGGIISPDPI